MSLQDSYRRCLQLVSNKAESLAKQQIEANRARLEFRALVRAGKVPEVKPAIPERRYGWTPELVAQAMDLRAKGHSFGSIGTAIDKHPDAVRRRLNLENVA